MTPRPLQVESVYQPTGDQPESILYLDTAPFVTREILHIDGGQNTGH